MSFVAIPQVSKTGQMTSNRGEKTASTLDLKEASITCPLTGFVPSFSRSGDHLGLVLETNCQRLFAKS